MGLIFFPSIFPFSLSGFLIDFANRKPPPLVIWWDEEEGGKSDERKDNERGFESGWEKS